MNHAAEGVLQAYLDGETTVEAAAEIEGHVAGCGDCRADLERLRADNLLVSSALQQLDLKGAELAPQQQAWWRVQAAARKPRAPVGRFTAGALARAAAILLVFAGALAAIPGSPLHHLLRNILSKDAPAPAVREQPAATPQPKVVPAPVAPKRAELPGMAIVPTEGRVRVLVWSAQPGATIRVNLVGGSRVSVEAGSVAEDVRFRTSSSRIEVMNLGSAEAVIRIPRSLPFATLEVDGRLWLFKEGDQLHLNGPVVEQGRDAVVFRAN